MIYIIGTKQSREEFESNHNIPFFEIEEELSDDVVCLHDHEDEPATLYVNLVAGMYTLHVFDNEANGIESEADYTNFDDAMKEYDSACSCFKADKEMRHRFDDLPRFTNAFEDSNGDYCMTCKLLEAGSVKCFHVMRFASFEICVNMAHVIAKFLGGITAHRNLVWFYTGESLLHDIDDFMYVHIGYFELQFWFAYEGAEKCINTPSAE